MFVPHDIEGLDKELYGFLSRYAADRYPDPPMHETERYVHSETGERKKPNAEGARSADRECMAGC